MSMEICMSMDPLHQPSLLSPQFKLPVHITSPLLNHLAICSSVAGLSIAQVFEFRILELVSLIVTEKLYCKNLL